MRLSGNLARRLAQVLLWISASAAVVPLSGAALVPVPSPKFNLQPGGLEVNRGQAKSEVLFVARRSNPLAVLAQSVVFSTLGIAQDLVASNPNPVVSFSDPLSGIVNVFTSADPQKWVTKIPRYATARLAGVYPGIDAEYASSSDGRLILRFHLQPGVDPAVIAFEVPKSFGLTRTPDGSLRIALGQSRFNPTLFYDVPIAFQETSSGRVSRKASFATRSAIRFGFQVEQISNAAPLQIEMTLPAVDVLVSPTLTPLADSSGNWFVTAAVADGVGKDAPFPSSGWAGCGVSIGSPIACTDVAVYKFSSNGDLIFASYLSGRTRESPAFLRLAPNGTVVVAGGTDSSDFPVTQGVVQPGYGGPAASPQGSTSFPQAGDFFAARLDPATGTLLASTYLGGPNGEEMGDTALGADGSVYFLHRWLTTSRPGMRTTPGALQATCDQDPCLNGYAAHLSAGLDKLLYGTYLPGNIVASAQLLWDGSVYYTGVAAAGFPTTPGAHQSQAAGGVDGIVARLDTSGTRLLFATYIGGPISDWISRMAVAPDGSVWVTISSYIEGVGTQNRRLVHLDASGQRILADVPLDVGDIAVDRQGNLIAMSGGNIRVGQDAFLANACANNAYVRLSPTGEQLFATYLPYLTFPDFAGASDRGTPLIQIGVDRFEVVEGQTMGAFLGCTVGAANFRDADRISPGGIVTLFGSKLGPEAGISFSLQDGRLPTVLGGTRVLVNGEAVPLLYASYWQVNAILPYSLAEGSNPKIQVENNGVATNVRLDARVQNAGIAIFSANGQTATFYQAAALNQDGTVNSAQNPAKAGSVVALFGTGGGQTIPASVAGELTPPELRRLASVVVATTAAGQPLQVTYAGAAPGLLAGVTQINVRLPDVLPTIEGFSPGMLPIGVVAKETSYSGGYVTVAVTPQ